MRTPLDGSCVIRFPWLASAPTRSFANAESAPDPYTVGSVQRTKRSNLSAIRVRATGVSNETVTTASSRKAVTPSCSGDSPGGTISLSGALTVPVREADVVAATWSPALRVVSNDGAGIGGEVFGEVATVGTVTGVTGVT